MKYFLIVTFITMTTLSTLAQTDNDQINATFKNYFNTIEQKDNAKTVDYLYPKLFQLIPKDKLLTSLNASSADTSTVVTLSDAIVKNISNPLIIDEVKYVLIKYSFKMTVLTPKNDNEGYDGSLQLTYDMFKELYGAKNVKLEQNTFYINVANQMYAIYDPTYGSWTFLEKKKSMKPILEKLLPKRILKEL